MDGSELCTGHCLVPGLQGSLAALIEAVDFSPHRWTIVETAVFDQRHLVKFQKQLV